MAAGCHIGATTLVVMALVYPLPRHHTRVPFWAPPGWHRRALTCHGCAGRESRMDRVTALEPEVSYVA